MQYIFLETDHKILDKISALIKYVSQESSKSKSVFTAFLQKFEEKNSHCK